MNTDRSYKVALALLILALGILACGSGERRQLILYPTATSVPNVTPTTVIVLVTVAPQLVVVEVTPTPNSVRLCVNAETAVYLRPAPNEKNYPITAVPNGVELTELGGRSENWVFVKFGEDEGWIYGNYLSECQ